MKNLIALLILTVLPMAYAAETNIELKMPSFVLMKCNAVKLGTLWVSFGRQRTSDSDKVTTFPTEIVVFDLNNAVSRKVYMDFREGLKIPVTADTSRISMEFPTDFNGVTKMNRLTVTVFDNRDPNSYLGNWKMVGPDQKEINDQAYCSVY